ncbi:stage II sporulation protein M [Alicyclobacillus sp.]|uniref:stage II sporulation protein M n=1 Tax=Alicyclobacillus sp. TaxID=61169 RepID=UPI0025C2119E|nr:stage II sporulation protein M [Alicyclobacillus sp.]MCL6515778.1 stage II sporulation protein M [Alicyclobacillus sp.]
MTPTAAAIPWMARFAAGWQWFLARGRAFSRAWMFTLAVILCGLAFGGVTAGQLNAQDAAVLARSVQELLTAISAHQLAPSHVLWWQRVIGDAQLLALLWLFGVSVIGLPFILIALFLRAFGVGFTVGFTVLQFGWRGLVVAGLAVFLHQLLSLTALMAAGIAAMRFSTNILQGTRARPNLPAALARYTAWFAVCLCGILAGAFVQAYIAPPLLTAAFAG